MLPNRKRFRSAANYLGACASESIGPLLRLAARARASAALAPAPDWRRGVIIGADHIGDVLYNTASLAHLRAGLPGCRWHYVAERPASEVIVGNPYLERTISRGQLRAMPRGSYDVAICYNSGALWRDLLFVTRLGIPNRVGYPDKGFSSLITVPIEINYPQPYPVYFRDLVGQLTEREPTWSLRPLIYPSPKDEDAAQKRWVELGLERRRAVVACFATSRQTSGIWPAEKFAETVKALETDGECKVVLCGTIADQGRLEQLKAAFNLRAAIMAGKLELLSLGCFLRRCDVVLCPDSGPRHLANAVGTPVIFVRNIAVGKTETGAYCETEIDVAPDFESVLPRDQARVFDLLRPETVAKLVHAQVN